MAEQCSFTRTIPSQLSIVFYQVISISFCVSLNSLLTLVSANLWPMLVDNFAEMDGGVIALYMHNNASMQGCVISSIIVACQTHNSTNVMLFCLG